MEENIKRGQVRVGRCTWSKGSRIDPEFSNFTQCLVLTKSSAYGSLGPYVLKDENGMIMENVWQFSKVYKIVPENVERFSRWNQRVIWKWPAEEHASIKEILSLPNRKIKTQKTYNIHDAYFKWRKAGMACKDAIRYPVGFKHRHECIFALATNEDGTVNNKPLNYIESRKVIYMPLYQRLVKKEYQFERLKKRLLNGENLLIIEVDGPHQESMKYYKDKYGIESNFIEKNTILATKENLQIMLNDDKHPFGHGYCLAAALLDLELE